MEKFDVEIRVVRLKHGLDQDLPSRASSGSAGFDLRAAVRESIVLEPGRRVLVPTGLSMAIPPGWEAQVRPRSGLALRHGVTVLNAPGTIDSDYRGEVGVILIHHGEEPLTIARGDRIAQLVFARVAEATWREVESLEESDRAAGGFGSTGR